MIGLVDIKRSLTELLQSRFTDRIHFDNVEKSDESYFYVEMTPRAATVDDVLTDRSIQVDVQYVGLPDRFGRVKRSRLYRVADTLDALFRPVIPIADRMITVPGTEITFHDEVVHCIFNLDFADVLDYRAAQGLYYELMQSLDLKINYPQNEGS